jgi:hypothetical protein
MTWLRLSERRADTKIKTLDFRLTCSFSYPITPLRHFERWRSLPNVAQVSPRVELKNFRYALLKSSKRRGGAASDNFSTVAEKNDHWRRSGQVLCLPGIRI